MLKSLKVKNYLHHTIHRGKLCHSRAMVCPWVEVGSHVFGGSVDYFMQSSVVRLLCHSWSDTVCVL
jgi:hypothetical protein